MISAILAMLEPMSHLISSIGSFFHTFLFLPGFLIYGIYCDFSHLIDDSRYVSFLFLIFWIFFFLSNYNDIKPLFWHQRCLIIRMNKKYHRM